MSPCEAKGYKIGDRFKVLENGAFSVGSIVELYRDDDTYSPLFKLIDGFCKWDNANGPGAYTYLDSVEKIVMTKEERIERLEKELAALKKECMEEWEPEGGGWFVNTEGTVGGHTNSISNYRMFGVERPTYELAEKARDAMRIHNRALAYVHEHAPDWRGKNPYTVWWNGEVWTVSLREFVVKSVGAVTGPERVMRQLADDLNSGRVKL